MKSVYRLLRASLAVLFTFASWADSAQAFVLLTRQIECRVLDVDPVNRLVTIQRIGTATSEVFQVMWTDRTVGFNNRHEAELATLQAGARIELRYSTPLFERHRIARSVRW